MYSKLLIKLIHYNCLFGVNSFLCGAFSAKSFAGVEMWKKPSDFRGLKSVSSKCWEKKCSIEHTVWKR